MLVLKIKSKLAPTPTKTPKYALTVKDQTGNDVVLGDPRATRALVALMNQHATIGGAAAHWGGPAAFAEMVSAVHGIMFKDKTKNWYETYNFVNDAGHAENGIYALRANYGFDNLTFKDLRGFRSIESKLTGHGEAHLNPQGVFISNGPLGSGLPQAQGLAIADKILGRTRTTICLLSDGGAMEGEAKESFAAIPGLAEKNKINPFVLIISDNNTKLGGRIDDDCFSMTPTFNSLSALGWSLIREEEGHNLQKVYTAIENAIIEAEKSGKPVAVVLKTIKGYGVKSTMESASGGHGYPLSAYDDKLVAFVKEIYGGDAPAEFTDWAEEILKSKPEPKATNPNAAKTEKVQDGFARAVIRAAKEGLPVYSISSDLQSSTGIKAFHKEFPTHYIDLGIAESNMISSAIGLSKQGLIPIVDTFAQFGITKGNLPFIMAGLSEGPVIALFSHTGFQDAADGASHQATTYFAALSSIPHITVVNCACSSEAESLMYEAITTFAKEREAGMTPNSVVFFLGRENHPVSYVEGMKYVWNKANVLTTGSDVTIVAAGPMVGKALEASRLLSVKNITATVINHSFVNHVDLETLKASLAATKGKLITIEDHQLIGGMGSMIVHALHTHGVDFKSKTLGILGEFGQSAYKADQLYARFDLSAEGIVKAFNSMN
ncbi:MAG: transketolase C-terminal domain-containing protein [Bacteriovorax sp.]|nr:transketolase C-terminal domain-containing protein [Bacteriovorax sp.]